VFLRSKGVEASIIGGTSTVFANNLVFVRLNKRRNCVRLLKVLSAQDGKHGIIRKIRAQTYGKA
ncbi:MAG: hypothetical protein PUK25_03765, partial [Clostridiales bacterium]|nr:hypothetical protein [Clostridiales bacterium]